MFVSLLSFNINGVTETKCTVPLTSTYCNEFLSNVMLWVELC